MKIGVCKSIRIAIAKNRKVSLDGKKYAQVNSLEIPESGLIVYLKNFGCVKVFRKTFKNETERYYITYLNDIDATEKITRQEFNQLHLVHRGIE